MNNILLVAVMSAAGDFLTPILLVIGVAAIAVVGYVVASRYKTVPPNGIGVFYGRSYAFTYSEPGPDGGMVTKTGKRGFRIITGGGKILIPVVERYEVMSTAAFQVEIEENQVPTSKNVPVQITAVATCRVSPIADDQANAVQAFLGKQQSEIVHTIKEILRGHVRSIIAKLSVEQILRDRAEFNKQVLEESSDEFRRLGIQIITLVVQDVQDSDGYIKALGRKETAGILRDAAIATAEADKETAIKTSNAQREAAEVKAQNAAKVADAEKTRDIQIAEFKVQTEAKKAEADLANAIAKTTQEQALKVKEAQRDAAAAEAGVLVQEKKAALKKKEYEATTIVEAEAKARASIIEATALKTVAEHTAQTLETESVGKANALVKEGEGLASKTKTIAAANAEATRSEAEGVRATNIALAEGIKAKLTAEAEGRRAGLMAEAEGSERQLAATASGKKAYLLAEAEGTKELSEALQSLSQQGQLLMIMDRLPPLLREGGDAGAKILAAVFTPIGESIKSIDNVSIVDMGGNSAKNGIAGFAGAVPSIVTEMYLKAKASGIDLTPLLSLLKIDASKLGDMSGIKPVIMDNAPSKKRRGAEDGIGEIDA